MAAESTAEDASKQGLEKILILGEDGNNGIMKTQLWTALAEEFGLASISEVF